MVGVRSMRERRSRMAVVPGLRGARWAIPADEKTRLQGRVEEVVPNYVPVVWPNYRLGRIKSQVALAIRRKGPLFGN